MRKIASFETFLEKFNDIRSSCRAVVGNAFDVSDLQLVQSIRKHLASGNERLDSIRKEEHLTVMLNNENEAREKELAEEFKIKEARRVEEDKIRNLLLCADTLVFEIKTRYETLWKKCSIRISELTDHEIFELKKREDTISGELREMIDKISEFEKFVVPCGDSADEMRKRVTAMRNNSTTVTDKYFHDLSNAITDRDISQKKLTNAAALTIKLSKFCGYESDLDIYSFRSEFRKLIEPQLQKYLWADYLKKNYLGGSALSLVSKEDSIDQIWDKLFNAFGDTQLLLQNKITGLDKFAQLEKLKDGKDEEKISYYCWPTQCSERPGKNSWRV